ncbi:hypothetical protein EM868_22520 [Cupriavidus gilardii]|uniref:hypothetical protein n=1 Tax=Cupriavidus gilardii TaxID=82541 RepID=UPI001572BF1C|nr:hypothetical protein [Cupriavidus gilardii]MCG5258654.1 hypothetical protein [Cupriavidus gilardii]MDF9432534.1 hypothetical protein [Cupriavidus gilardii]NSX06950.1 hypothetical protein [Cupriavidus gilardii]
MKKIKLMADYYCFPLWEASPGEVGNIDPADLPISPQLRIRLLKWAEKLDKTLNMDYPPDSRFPSEAEERQFKREGFELADELRSELGPDYEVILHLW